MSRLVSWQPPRLRTVIMVFVPALTIVLIGVGATHQAPSTGKTATVQHTPSASASTVVSLRPSPHAPATAEFSPVGTISLDSSTWSNIKSAVQIWAAYPNRDGRAATLAKLQLNRAVSPDALKDVIRQWARPQSEPVNVTVESVIIEKLPSFTSATEATLVGVVTAAKQYSDSKVTHVRINVDVQLRKVGAVWRIFQLDAL